jgi:hypothetical protein
MTCRSRRDNAGRFAGRFGMLEFVDAVFSADVRIIPQVARFVKHEFSEGPWRRRPFGREQMVRAN